ncbi:MAG: PAS domain S-box protein [Pseudomonadales bacterium]|nr:PAS domain S-box protein [Pseudomonadales bacterium]
MSARSSQAVLSIKQSLRVVVLVFLPAIAMTVLAVVGASGPQPAVSWPLIISLVATLIIVLAAWKYTNILTGLQNKESELSQKLLLVEGFFERNPAMMWVKDLQGEYLAINQAFRKFTNTEDTPVDCVKHEELFGSVNADAMADQDRQVVEYKLAMEFEGVWPNGEGKSYYSILRFPLFDEKGDVIAVAGIANDRTDQVRARKALRESEKQFRTLVESAPDAVLISNSGGKILLVNKQAEILLGLSRKELLRRTLEEVIPTIDLKHLERKVRGNDGGPIEKNLFSTSIKDSEGIEKPVEVAISTSRTEEDVALTCLVRDVSDRLKLESMVRQTQKMDAIGKLTGGMAHDFNNLLGVIMGNVDLASRKLEEDSPLRKRLETIRKASESGADLTKRMLAVARRQPLQPKATNINRIIEEMSDILPRTLGPDIEIRYSIRENMPPVLIDKSGLENVILNLAINSRDAMPSGGEFKICTDIVHLTESNPFVKQDDVSPGTYVLISFTDEGEGMPEEVLQRVFEPFFTTKERGKGTGLGLAMSYGFVKQSGGSIQIFSEPGKGTKLDILLPVCEEVEAASPTESTQIESVLSGNNAEKVLVVDDEPELLEVTSTFMEDMGFDVISAANGKEGMRALRNNPDTNLLFTDIVMPGGINGVKLAKQAREEVPGIKVLYMSGFPSGVIADRSGMELDAPLITKPYSMKELASALDVLLREAP